MGCDAEKGGEAQARAGEAGVKTSDKKQMLADATAHYLREVGRRKQKGQEPNDRGHDRRLEQKLKRMAPEEVDALFRGEPD